MVAEVTRVISHGDRSAAAAAAATTAAFWDTGAVSPDEGGESSVCATSAMSSRFTEQHHVADEGAAGRGRTVTTSGVARGSGARACGTGWFAEATGRQREAREAQMQLNVEERCGVSLSVILI